jgi:phytoene/squalene synthetase
LEGNLSGGLKKLLEFQAARAWEYFGKARQALRSSGEGRKLLPARIMAGVYARLLRRIQESGYDVCSRRVSVLPWERVQIAAQMVVGQVLSLRGA